LKVIILINNVPTKELFEDEFCLLLNRQDSGGSEAAMTTAGSFTLSSLYLRSCDLFHLSLSLSVSRFLRFFGWTYYESRPWRT